MISEDAILEALCEHAGINAAQNGEVSLRKEIRRAIESCAHPCGLLDPGSTEWQDLLESVLVPETWFFRNMEELEALAQWVTESWLPTHPGECLRVLSLPCATGEEPYSIAIRLLEAGIPRESIRIRAGDISEKCLNRAREAIYRRNSFRTGFDEPRYGKYFDDVGDGARQIGTSIRGMVEFERINLVHSSLPVPQSHVIFCRNALIYFGLETQREVLMRLHAALSDDGILFLGPVEPPVALQCGFLSAKLPMAFACVKKSAESANHPLPPPIASPPRLPRRLPPATKKPGSAMRPATPTTRPLAPPLEDSLELAHALANSGSESAAADVLDRLAATAAPTAEFYCLRGVVSDALGFGDLAETYYRKALYLDPSHGETIAHLALHFELTGRQAAAAQVRRRNHQKNSVS